VRSLRALLFRAVIRRLARSNCMLTTVLGLVAARLLVVRSVRWGPNRPEKTEAEKGVSDVAEL